LHAVVLIVSRSVSDPADLHSEDVWRQCTCSAGRALLLLVSLAL